MIQQMLCVQRYFGKEISPKMIHLIVDYGILVNDDETAVVYSRSCAKYFQQNHQIYHCTHQNIQLHGYHTHMLVNLVSYIDGNVFDAGIKNMNRFCEYISVSLGNSSRLLFQKE